MKDPKWIFPVVAAFLALSSLAHGILGWKAMSAELARTGASPDLLADLATGGISGVWLWLPLRQSLSPHGWKHEAGDLRAAQRPPQ